MTLIPFPDATKEADMDRTAIGIEGTQGTAHQVLDDA